MPFLICPSFTLQKTITPLYASYKESKISALSGASISPVGGGTTFTICSKTSPTFNPVLAEMSGASLASKPIISSISSLTRSGSALGRSILLITGIISRSCSNAK